MPLFSLTETLRADISNALPFAPIERATMYQTALESGEISLDSVIALQRDMQEHKKVHELLKGAKLLPPPPKKRFVQSPKTKAKFEQYRRELENKQYANMVKNIVQPLENDFHRDRREIKSFRDQLGIALNVIITRLALLATGWWIGHRSMVCGKRV